MDISKLEDYNRAKITAPKLDAVSVYTFYRDVCDWLFDSKTKNIFFPLLSEYKRPVLCLEYISRIFIIAQQRGWFNDFGKYKELKKQVAEYDKGFKMGYSELENKFKNKPEYQQKEVFSEIINFPGGLSLKPYQWYVRVVILADLS